MAEQNKAQSILLTLPPLSLYIHFPWCVRKCPYCDFNSHQLTNTIPAGAYLDALLLNFESHTKDIQGRKIHSIFLGGGTPSLFPTKELAQLFDFLDQGNFLANNCEITLEANPGAIEHGKFSDYKKMGINRISLGAQSFQDDKLKALGRIHHHNDIYDAVDALVKVGFDNFNIDIMHGLPNQTLEDALFDLRDALSLNPTHLSWYQLTIEPNTAFAIKAPKLPNEDTLASIEHHGKEMLKAKGFSQYETSAFAVNESYQAKHNLNYWRFGDYIGIGAGAHSKITDITTKQITRYWQRKHPSLYMAEKKFPYGHAVIKSHELPYEFMLNSLRLFEGFKQSLFETRTGLSLASIEKPLQKALDQKLLIKEGKDHYYPSELGQRFLNDLINLFI